MSYSPIDPARHTSPATTALLLLATGLAATSPVAAQSSEAPEGYADDFSRDSLRYGAEVDTNSAGNGTAEIVADGVRLRVDAPEGADDYLFFTAAAPGDTFSATVSMASITGAVDGQGGVWLEAFPFNSRADFGGENGDQDSDVYAAITLDFFGNGGRAANLCLATVRNDGPWDVYPGFGDDGSGCVTFEDFLPEFGTEYTLGLALDREAATLTASIDGLSQVVPLSTPIFAAASQRRDVQLVRFGEGTAAATVHGIATETFADDFRSDPIALAPYQTPDDSGGREGTVRVVDGRARFDVASDGESYRQASLRFTRDNLPDYLEVDIMLSSETALSSAGRAGARLQGRLYNDTAEGGFNDREGDVYASVELTFRGNGGRSAEYCLNRIDDADGEARTPLLDGGDNCVNFGFLPELDTAYEARLILDREAGTITFAIDDEVRVHDIATAILEPGSGYREIIAYADNDAAAIAFADDLRTAEDALTSEEIAAAGAPVGTSDPMDGAMPVDVVDSTTDTNASDGSGGSGGGCSIVSGGSRDPLLSLLALLGLLGIVRRRRSA